MSRSICIIVPCYNEAQRLDRTAFYRFAETHPEMRFVMVNDGSQDETLSVLEGLRQTVNCPIEIVDLQTNQGKAEAVRRGMEKGFEFTPDYIGYWDADLATPLNAIGEMATVLDQRTDMDVVIASRLPLLGRRIERHWLRKKIGRACGFMASLVLGTRIQDTQCGAKMFRVTPVTRQVFATPLTARWLFDVELFARLIQTWKAAGGRSFSNRVFEYPLHQWAEIPGSKLKKMDFLKAGWELAQIYFRYLSPLAPTHDVSKVEPATAPVPNVVPLNRRAA